MSGVSCTPHHPGRGSSKSTGECEHLDTGIATEGLRRNDLILNRVGSSGTHGDSSQHLKDSTEDHRLSVGDGSGGHTRCPGVCHIVFIMRLVEIYEIRMKEGHEGVLTCTVVEGIEEGEEGANGKHVGVLVEGHLVCRLYEEMPKRRCQMKVVATKEELSKRKRHELYIQRETEQVALVLILCNPHMPAWISIKRRFPSDGTHRTISESSTKSYPRFHIAGCDSQ